MEKFALSLHPDRTQKGELKRRMHEPIPQQGRWLGQVVRGYFLYHAVPTNYPRLAAFRFHVTELWWRTLRRRTPLRTPKPLD